MDFTVLIRHYSLHHTFLSPKILHSQTRPFLTGHPPDDGWVTLCLCSAERPPFCNYVLWAGMIGRPPLCLYEFSHLCSSWGTS